MIANHKSQYSSVRFRKDNIGIKILPKFISLGGWFNGMAIHPFKECKKAGGRGESNKIVDSVLDVLSQWYNVQWVPDSSKYRRRKI